MKHIALAFSVIALSACRVQTGVVPLTVEPGESPGVQPVPCIATERMPIAGLGAKPRSRMPAVRPEGNWPMPTIPLVPCYLRDTLAALQKR